MLTSLAVCLSLVWGLTLYLEYLNRRDASKRREVPHVDANGHCLSNFTEHGIVWHTGDRYVATHSAGEKDGR